MKITSGLTDDAVLSEVGERVARTRLARNMTQSALAAEAGVSTSTLARLESGAVGTQLSGLVRVCRALGLLGGFDQLVPELGPSPIDELREISKSSRTARRQRATRTSAARPNQSASWTWGSDS